MLITDNDYTDYVNTDSSRLDDSEGFIQPMVNASGFSYSKHVLRGNPIPGEGGIVSGPWRVRVRESESPASPVIFEQKVIYRVMQIGEVFIPQDDANPDIPWDQVKGKTLIQTTIINGVAVPERQAWQHVDTPTPTKFSEFGITIFDPNRTPINVQWQSPRYRVDLPAGAVFEVVEDTWRAGTAIPISFFQVSIRHGADGLRVDSTLDGFGDMLVARVPSGSKISRVVRPVAPFSSGFGSARGFVPGTQPTVLMKDDGEVVVGALLPPPGGYAEWVSNNDGARFERAKYPEKDSGVIEEAELWPVGAKMPQLAKVEGGRVTLAVMGNDLMARTIRDGGGFGSAGIVGAPVRVIRAVSGRTYSISLDESGQLWVFDNEGIPRAVSSDGGGAWKEVDESNFAEGSAAGGPVNV